MQKLDKELLVKARENNELLTKAYDIISQSAKALAEIKYENGHNALVCLLDEITTEMEKNALADPHDHPGPGPVQASPAGQAARPAQDPEVA